MPHKRVPLDIVAERRQASSRVEAAEGSQDSAAAPASREQAWPPQQNRHVERHHHSVAERVRKNPLLQSHIESVTSFPEIETGER